MGGTAAIIGAVVGAATSDDPLEGAIVGGGLGWAGGTYGPGAWESLSGAAAGGAGAVEAYTPGYFGETVLSAPAWGGTAATGAGGTFLGPGGAAGALAGEAAGGFSLIPPATSGFSLLPPGALDTLGTGAGGILSGVAGGGGVSPLGGFGPVSTALTLGSGVVGLRQAEAVRKAAEKAGQRSDPFGQYRGQYAQQLSALTANPALIEQQPGYQYGLRQAEQGLTRQLARGGFMGSGQGLLAAADLPQRYATQYLNQEQARLAQLAGADIRPDTSSYMQGEIGASQLMGQSLATLGYGASRMGW